MLHDALAKVIAAAPPGRGGGRGDLRQQERGLDPEAGPGARRGAAGAGAGRHLPVAEYPANLVKKSVVGAGHADKHQVQMMVRRLLPGCLTRAADAADALAVAICHAHHAGTRAPHAPRRWREAGDDRQAHRHRRQCVGSRLAPSSTSAASAIWCSARRARCDRLPARGERRQPADRDPCARGPYPSLRLRRRGRARLVPPADDGAGRRRQAGAVDPRRAGAGRARPGHRRPGQGQPDARQRRRPEARQPHRHRAEGQGRRHRARRPGRARRAERASPAARSPMRSRRWSISAIAAARRSAPSRSAARAARRRGRRSMR